MANGYHVGYNIIFEKLSQAHTAIVVCVFIEPPRHGTSQVLASRLVAWALLFGMGVGVLSASTAGRISVVAVQVMFAAAAGAKMIQACASMAGMCSCSG